jgi:hypothetical protein
MTNYITKGIQIIFRCGFKGILASLVSVPKSTPDFPGLLLFFVEIMLDELGKFALDISRNPHIYYAQTKPD